jgi:hypothetical protein
MTSKKSQPKSVLDMFTGGKSLADIFNSIPPKELASNYNFIDEAMSQYESIQISKNQKKYRSITDSWEISKFDELNYE